MIRKLIVMLAVAHAVVNAWAWSFKTEYANGYTWSYEQMFPGVRISATLYVSSPAVSPLPTGAVTIPSTLGGEPVT